VWYSRCFTSKIVFATFSIFVCAIDSSRAQGIRDDTLSIARLGVHISAGLGSYREDLLVPLSFDGPRFSLGAVYSTRLNNHCINSRLTFGIGFPKNRFSHTAYVLDVELRSSWLLRISRPQDIGGFWLGICLPLRMTNMFFDSWDDAHLYWLTAYMLGAAVRWEKAVFQDAHAVVQVDIPFLGFASRPPEYRYAKQEALNQWTYHFAEPNKGLQFSTLDTYRAILIQALLIRQLASSTLTVGIEFDYQYSSRPSPIQTMRTSVSVSYQWTL